MTSERELNEAVKQAVGAADRVILDASDGSTEETNWLTAQVASKLVEKVEISLGSALLRRRIEQERRD